jgi:myo-inositol 2-dehydrogenase/D-chiro-inositol 1-dehydrogenase
MRTLSIALLGAGRIGRMHAELLARSVPEARLDLVCDPSADFDGWLEPLGVERTERDARRVFADPAIEAVVIAAPSPLHAELAIGAARAGKHVFCEKPLSFELPLALAVAKARDESGVTLQIGFNRRFDPDLRRLAAEVRAGAIGQLELVEIVNRDPALPSFEFLRGSGGIFFDFVIHDFDVARFLSGAEIEAVYARAAALVEPRLAEIGDADSAITLLRMTSGALVAIVNSRQSRCGYDQRVEAFGARGSLALDNRLESALVASHAAGVVHGKPLPTFAERYREAYAAELGEFCRAALAGRAAEVSVEDVIAAVRAARAAKLSVAENRAVRLDEIQVPEAA